MQDGKRKDTARWIAANNAGKKSALLIWVAFAISYGSVGTPTAFEQSSILYANSAIVCTDFSCK